MKMKTRLSAALLLLAAPVAAYAQGTGVPHILFGAAGETPWSIFASAATLIKDTEPFSIGGLTAGLENTLLTCRVF